MTEQQYEYSYNAGWSDMREMAAKLAEAEGQCALADAIRAIEKPPSGDK